MPVYKDVEMLCVTRWSEDAEEWQLFSTGIPVGSREELKFFCVIVPHESGRKMYFDSPESYLQYSHVEDEDELVTTERSRVIEEAALAWRERNAH